ncbi:hypothetical protein LEM8419_01043 [Neolewinella maritima]|uniref:OsmC family peroxiredoxin n=1 Tax=Neolewinella maritima TaxID=1383882 RepID=A0ABM9AZ42_9BACT|nr:OsmC family protein [Neolewinella maritima]CAH0999743.1 hypothetical protein LEM8419_01043 [Neolewinella maritima]
MTHHYTAHLTWTGNHGAGTHTYTAYGRDYELSAPGKTVTIPGSSDPAFRGDPSRYSPEDLLVQSLAACHMLWYLHLCATKGVIVRAYTDAAEGEMTETDSGDGQFASVTLHPTVVVTEAGMVEQAEALHAQANRRCFIARSVNFPVHHAGTVRVG